MRLEVFNEMTTILLYSIAYTLTDLPLNNNIQKQHEYAGWLFIAAMTGNISTHLIFLFKDMVQKTILYCKYRYANKQVINEEEIAPKAILPTRGLLPVIGEVEEIFPEVEEEIR